MKFSARAKRLILLIRCLFRFMVWGSATHLPSPVSRIIVVPTGKLGDVVCTTPVLAALRTYLPKAWIIVAGDSRLHQILLADSGLVDEYLDLRHPMAIKQLKQTKAQAALVTGPSFASAAPLYLAGIPLVVAAEVRDGFSPFRTRPYKILERLIQTFPYRFGEYAPRERLRCLEPLGIFTDNTTKCLGFSAVGVKKVAEFLVRNSLDSERDFIVGLSPSAGNKIKEWPTERFAKVVDHLYQKYGAKMVIFGSNEDRAKVREVINYLDKKTVAVDAAGTFDLDGLKALISKLKLFVSVDTGPIYIAEAFNVPTVDIVGPVDERVQPPRGPLHRSVVPDRLRPELSILNARSYDQKEAIRQVLSISTPAVLEAIDELIYSIYKNRMFIKL